MLGPKLRDSGQVTFPKLGSVLLSLQLVGKVALVGTSSPHGRHSPTALSFDSSHIL